MRHAAIGLKLTLFLSVTCVSALGQKAPPGHHGDDASSEIREALFPKLQRAVLSLVTVERTTKEGTEFGCGFFIDDHGTFVTVLPARGETLEMTVRYGGRKFLPQLLAIDDYARLAILKLDGVSAPGLDLAPNLDWEVGDHLAAMAETSDGANPSSIGRVAGREKNFNGIPLAATLLRLNLQAQPGWFGAPLMNSEGQVGGVILMTNDERPGLCYGLPAEPISKVRRDYQKHGAVKPCWIGIRLEQGTTTPEIASLDDKSPAKTAGLKTGDVIRQIGKTPIRDCQDVSDACYYLTAGEPVSITILRDLEDLILEITPSHIEEPEEIEEAAEPVPWDWNASANERSQVAPKV